MSSNAHGTAVRHVHTLFNAGAVGGLTDRELLELFKVRRGETAESAFAAIVERHGPMVHRVLPAGARGPGRRRRRFPGDIPRPHTEG